MRYEFDVFKNIVRGYVERRSPTEPVTDHHDSTLLVDTQ